MVSVTEPEGANTPDEIATFIEELDNEIKNTAHLQQGGSIPGNLSKCADTHGNSDPADVYTFTEEDACNNTTEPFRCFTNTKEKSNPCNLADNYKSAKVTRNPFENKVVGKENEEDILKPSLKLTFFSCEYCNNCFARKEFWLRHRKRIHGVGFNCHACQSFFRDKTEFNIHLKSHFHQQNRRKQKNQLRQLKIKSQKSQIIFRKKALSAIRVLSVEEINLKYIQNSAYVSNKSLSYIPRKQRNSQIDPKISKILSTKNSSFHHSNSKCTNKKSLPKDPSKKLKIQPCVVNIQNCITPAHFPVKKCFLKLKRCDNLFRKLALIPSTLKIQIRKKNQNDKALKKLFNKYYIDDNERDEADVEMTKERFLANFGLGPCKPPPASILTQNATQETVQDDLPLPIKEITQNANLTQGLCENKKATDENANDENDCIEYIGEIQFQDNAILEEVDSKEITIAEVWSESFNEEPANKVETKSTSHEESQIPESTKENNSILNSTDKILTEIPTNQEKRLSNIPKQTIKSTQLVKYSCKICHTLFDFESKLKIHEIFHERHESQSKKNISTEKMRVNKKRQYVKSSSTTTDRQQCKQLFSCPFNGCKIVLNRKGLKAMGDKHLLRVHATAPSNKFKWIKTNRDNVCQ